MNKFFAMMVALLATVFATSAFAWDPPPSPAPKSWISDPGHVLSDDAHARLDAKLKVINQSSANEMAALILPSLNGESIEDAGDLTSKAWGVGKKNLDNGVLVVLAMKEHKSRISTGKGVEGDLPDLKCNDILQAMRPYLRSNNVEGALGYAFDQASTLIANHKAEAAAQAAKAANSPVTPAAAPQASSNRTSSCQVSAPGSSGGGFLWLLVFGGGTALLIWWLASRANARRQEEEDLEERNRLAADAARLRQERINAELAANRRAEEARLQREVTLTPPTPVEVPVIRPSAPAVSPVVPVVAAVTAAAVINEAAEAEARREHEAAARRRRLQEEEDANRRRREQAEEDDRRRRDSESSSSYSSSSSSSWDSGSSWGGGGGSDSGGFGGGDSGGGGSSSDW